MSRKKLEQKQPEDGNNKVGSGKRKAAPDKKTLEPKRRKIQSMDHPSEHPEGIELTKQEVEQFLLSLTNAKLKEELTGFSEGLTQFYDLITYLKAESEKTGKPSNDPKKFLGNHSIPAIKEEILQRKNMLMQNKTPEYLMKMTFNCMMLILNHVNTTQFFPTLRHFLKPHSGSRDKIDLVWADAIFIGLKESIALLVHIQQYEQAPKKDIAFRLLDNFFRGNERIKSKVPEIRMWVYHTHLKKNKVTFLDSWGKLEPLLPSLKPSVDPEEKVNKKNFLQEKPLDTLRCMEKASAELVQCEGFKLKKQDIEDFFLEHSSKKLKGILDFFYNQSLLFKKIMTGLQGKKSEAEKLKTALSDDNIAAIKAEIIQRTKTPLPNDNLELVKKLPFFCTLSILQSITMGSVHPVLCRFIFIASTQNNIGGVKRVLDEEWAQAIFTGMKESIALLARIQNANTRDRKQIMFNKLEKSFLRENFKINEINEIKVWVYGISFFRGDYTYSDALQRCLTMQKPSEDSSYVQAPAYANEACYHYGASIDSTNPIYYPENGGSNLITPLHADNCVRSLEHEMLYSQENQGTLIPEIDMGAYDELWEIVSDEMLEQPPADYYAQTDDAPFQPPVQSYFITSSQRFFSGASPQTQSEPAKNPTIFYK